MPVAALNFKMRKRKYYSCCSALVLFTLIIVFALVQGDVQKAETQVPGIVQPKTGNICLLCYWISSQGAPFINGCLSKSKENLNNPTQQFQKTFFLLRHF